MSFDLAIGTANQVKAIMEPAIEGLEMHVFPDVEAGRVHIRGIYQCPCGDISSFNQVVLDLDRQPPAEVIADQLTAWLRKHVIGEGNVPNF